MYASSCMCPVPCEFSLFEPSFSYATISNHVVRTLLTSNDSLSLKSRLLHASETTARMEKAKKEEFKVLVEAVNDKFHILKELLRRMSKHLSNQTQEIRNVHNETRSAYFEKERLYRFQIYAIERNFLRGREAMEERVLSNVALGFAEFAMLNARRIRRLAVLPEAESESREELYELIIDSLKVRQEIGDLAEDNISVLYDAFVNGTKIFNYKFEDISRSHNPYIVPKPLLNDSMHHNWYVRKYGPKMFDDLDLLHNVLDRFMNEATIAFLNSTVNDTSLNYTFERYQFSCRTFMYSKSVIYSQGIDRPVPILKERLVEFDKHWDDFDSQYTEMEQNLESLVASIKAIETHYVENLNIFIENLLEYVNSKNNSMMLLAQAILSDNVQRTLSTIKDLFLEVENRGQAIHDSWTLLMDDIKSLWTMIIKDEDMKEYYEFTNNTRFLQNLTEVVNKYMCQCKNVRDNLDVREAVQNEDEEFFRATDELTSHLSDFKNSIKIDSSFLR